MIGREECEWGERSMIGREEGEGHREVIWVIRMFGGRGA